MSRKKGWDYECWYATYTPWNRKVPRYKKGSTPDKRKKGDKQKKFSWFLNEKEGEGAIQKKTAQRRTGDLLKENNNTATIERRYVSDGRCGMR